MSGGERALARATAWGVVWAFAATAAGKLLALAALAVLARLLVPEDFGLLAFALVWIAYLETVGDLGAGAALIYWPGRRAAAARVSFAVNLATGAAWCGLTQLAAPAVAEFFHRPDGEAVLRVLALAFPLKALGNTHDALCQRGMRFRARMVPELALAATKAGAALALAAAGFGVWSLVWGQLLGLAAWTVALWRVVPWRPWHRVAGGGGLLRPLLAYGRRVVAVNVLAAIVHHADLVVVGRMAGSAALGFYQVAYKVPEATVTVAIWVVGRVLFPAFSRLAAAGRGLADALPAALRYLALVTLPAAAGLFVLAEPLVTTLFGARWAPSAPLLQALAVYAALRSVGSPAGDVLKALGRPGLLAALGAAKATLLVPVLVLAGGRGALAVAAALAAVTALTAAVNLGVAAHLTPVPARRLAAALAPGAAAALAVIPALLAARHLADGAGALALGAALGGGAWLLALRAFAPEALGRARAALSARRAAVGSEPVVAAPERRPPSPVHGAEAWP